MVHKESLKPIYKMSLLEYNQSKLQSKDILDGKSFRKLKRKIKNNINH